MSTNLGFGGAGGVGRPFTFQDLFSAVSSSGISDTASTIPITLNEFLDTVDYGYGSDFSTSLNVKVSVTQQVPVVYNNGNWKVGVWG